MPTPLIHCARLLLLLAVVIAPLPLIALSVTRLGPLGAQHGPRFEPPDDAAGTPQLPLF